MILGSASRKESKKITLVTLIELQKRGWLTDTGDTLSGVAGPYIHSPVACFNPLEWLDLLSIFEFYLVLKLWKDTIFKTLCFVIMKHFRMSIEKTEKKKILMKFLQSHLKFYRVREPNLAYYLLKKLWCESLRILHFLS